MTVHHGNRMRRGGVGMIRTRYMGSLILSAVCALPTCPASPGGGGGGGRGEARGTRREPAVGDTDLRQGRVLGTSLAAVIAALAAAGFTVASGGVGAAALAAAAAAGGAGAAGTLIGHKLAQDE